MIRQGVLMALGVCLAVASGMAAPEASEPGLTVEGNYERFRRVRIHIVAPLGWAKQQVTAKDGKRVLGSTTLQMQAEKAVAELTLPMPSSLHGYGKLSVQSGKESATLTLPDLETERQNLIDSMPLLFTPAVFSGEEFPPGDFSQPSLLEDALGGPYTLKTSFYDVNYKPAAKAEKIGRYGAVVEVKTLQGNALKRFVTLYRTAGAVNWRASKPQFTGEMPPEMGLDPSVMPERSAMWSRYLVDNLLYGFVWNPSSAPLFAGLHEAKPGGGSGNWNNAYHVDESWWHGLKKKLGEIQPVRYLLDLPEGYEADPNKKWPLLIFLHGSGESGDNLKVLRRHGPPKMVAEGHKFPFVLLSPQAPKSYLIGTQLTELLDEIEKKFRIDINRIYMTGLSSGGNSTWYTALEYPERFAAIIPIAASGDPGGAYRLKNLPVWYFVGGKDTNIAPGGPEQMVEAMKAAGVPYKFTLYPEAGHGETWEKAYADPALYEWMLSQKKTN